MALASLELVLNFPLATYGLYLTASREPIQPWVSWADTHADFLQINQVPALFWRSDKHTQATVELSRWAGVICALAFFGFFGFAAEARKHYRLAFWAVAKRCGFTPPADGAFPSMRLPWSKSTSKSQPFATGSGVKSLPISLPLTPVKQRTDSLFTDSLYGADTDTDAHSLGREKARACEYILPSPSSSGFAPPRYAYPRDIEAGAYVYPVSALHPAPDSPSSPSSTYAEGTETDGDRTPTSTRTLIADPRPRPTTWPSLEAQRPHAPHPNAPHAPAS
jgi:hypothetical protein